MAEEKTALTGKLEDLRSESGPQQTTLLTSIRDILDANFSKTEFKQVVAAALGYFDTAKTYFSAVESEKRAATASAKFSQSTKTILDDFLGKNSTIYQAAAAALGYFNKANKDEKKDEDAGVTNIVPNSILDTIAPAADATVPDDNSKDDKKSKNRLSFFDKKTTKVNSIKESDFKEFPAALTMGFLLLHEDITKPKKKEEKKKGGGILDTIGSLLGFAIGVVALAGALIVFAAAMKIFDDVDWKDGLIGAGAFVLFIAIMIGLSKTVAANKGSFLELGKGALLLTASLALFGVTLWLLGTIVKGGEAFGIKMPGLAASMAGVGLFIAFIGFMTTFAKTVAASKVDFMQFAATTIVLDASLALFALSLVIVGTIMSGGSIFGLDVPSVGSMIGGVVLFTTFIGAMAAFAALVGANQGNFMQLAVGSLILDASLALFAGSLFIIGTIISGGEIFGLEVPSIGSMVLGVVIFVAFTAVMAAIGVGIGAASPAFIALGVGSAILSASLALFAGALWLVGTLLNPELMLNVMAVLALGIPVVAEAALLAGTLVLAYPLLLIGTPAAAVLTAFSLALSASVAALALAAKSMTLLKDNNDFSSLSTALNSAIDAVYGGNRGLGKVAWLAEIAGATAIAVMLVPLTLALNATVLALAGAAKLTSLLQPEAFRPFYNVISEMTTALIAQADKIKGRQDAFTTITTSLPQIANAMKTLADTVTILSKLDLNPEKMELVKTNMSNCVKVMGEAVAMLVEQSNKLGEDARKSMPVITKSLKPLVNAIGMMPDVVRKTADLKLDPETAAIVFDNLQKESDVMMQMLDELASISEGISKSAANRMKIIAESLKPLIEAFSMMPDAVKKIADLDLDEQSSQKIAVLTKKLADVMNTMMSGITAVAAVLGKKNAEAFKTISESLPNVISVYNDMPKTIDRISEANVDVGVIDKAEQIADVVTQIITPIMKLAKKFKDNVVANAKTFAAGFKDMATSVVEGVKSAVSSLQGIDIDETILEKLDRVTDDLVPSISKLIKKLQKVATSEIDTNAMSSLCDSMKTSVQSFIDTANSAGSFSIEGLSVIDDFLTRVAKNKTFESGAKAVSNGLDKISDSIENLPEDDKIKTYSSSFLELADALDRLTTPRSYESLTQLQHIGDTSKDIKKLNTSLQELNNTFKQLNRGQGWLSKLADGLGAAIDNARGVTREMQARNGQIANGANAQMTTAASSAVDRYVREMTQIMRQWNENGLKVVTDLAIQKENGDKDKMHITTYDNTYKI